MVGRVHATRHGADEPLDRDTAGPLTPVPTPDLTRPARRPPPAQEPWTDSGTVRWILKHCQTWAIVGLADNPARPAYRVAHFLQAHGKRIVPVHPRAETVFGQPGFRTLTAIPFEVDCVDVFRAADHAGRFADEAVTIGAKSVWFQLEAIDHAAYERTTRAGLRMVMDRCPAIEWPASA